MNESAVAKVIEAKDAEAFAILRLTTTKRIGNHLIIMDKLLG